MKHEDVKELVRRFESANKILIIAHKNPDGDAVGASASLAALLEKAGKDARIIYPDKVAARLEFILRGRKYMTPETRDAEFLPELTVCLDSASPSRLGALEEELAGKTDISIDHHDVCSPFADKTYTDSSASATSEIIYHIAAEFVQCGLIEGLDCDICCPMYAGIASDTGNFKYSNTTAETFTVCAEILKTGIDHAQISRLLFDTYPLGKIKAESIAAEQLEVFAGGLAAVIAVDTECLPDGVSKEDFDDAVNIARRLAGVEIGAYIRPSSDKNGYKVSLRSNAYADVAKTAALHGGGGHIRAAGCNIKADSLDAAKKILMCDIENALAEAERSSFE